MLWVTAGIALFGLLLAPMFAAGTTGALLMMALGLSLMGVTYGPLGTVISELFPTPVRYTGSSLAFSFASSGAEAVSFSAALAFFNAPSAAFCASTAFFCASTALLSASLIAAGASCASSVARAL